VGTSVSVGEGGSGEIGGALAVSACGADLAGASDGVVAAAGTVATDVSEEGWRGAVAVSGAGGDAGLLIAAVIFFLTVGSVVDIFEPDRFSEMPFSESPRHPE